MRHPLLILCAVLIGLPAPAPAEDIVREQKQVQIGKITETWQLVWHGKPEALCPASDMESSMTCPCAGFAYGEQGDLSLVRKRGNRIVERLPLNPAFHYVDVAKGKAGLQLKPLDEKDIDRDTAKDRKLSSDIQMRLPADVMVLKDYDHDGRATEFLVLLGNISCGHQMYAAVGVTRRVPYLHLLSTDEHPRSPLIMDIEQWNALLTAQTPTTIRVWDCGDHGSDYQTDFRLHARDGHIHVTERTFACRAGGKPPRRLNSRPWRSDY